MTRDGQRIGRPIGIDNDPFDLAQQVASWGESPEVVLEATYGWYWAADVLADVGATVHLAHPLGVKGFAYRRVKNDERDAADLAELLRMGRLPEAWIAPPEVRGLREAFAIAACLSRCAPGSRLRSTRYWPSRESECRCRTCSASVGRSCSTSCS
jgi:hypothetical protein